MSLLLSFTAATRSVYDAFLPDIAVVRAKGHHEGALIKDELSFFQRGVAVEAVATVLGRGCPGGATGGATICFCAAANRGALFGWRGELLYRPSMDASIGEDEHVHFFKMLLLCPLLV